ncbi:MAG: nitroreductase/quinone reductase family protein, partial [Actinomycetota bacterium]|nr:nitroreductase/quinone reductase family protein [Actinomycetota bacterium]
ISANPAVTVEVGDDSFSARAIEVTGAARDEIFARQAAAVPQFGEYQQDNPRMIPVVELVRAAQTG